MSVHVRAALGGFLFSCLGAACIFPTTSVETARVVGDAGTSSPGLDSDASVPAGGGCNADSDCSAAECAQWHCVDHKCTPTSYPSGTTPTGSAPPSSTVCQRTVCDGDGGLTSVPDPSAVSTQAPPTCMRNACTADGRPTFAADLSNAPASTPGSCQKLVCDADGGTSAEPDPTNVPSPTTCATFSCSDGMAVSTPSNPTGKCSDLGFVCGSDGQCATCPAPDASCDEPGVGSRVSTSPHDFQGIGRTDTGGRYLCGAVPSGAASYYTYYDDQTGFLAVFDPDFEISPTAPVTLCAYFDCASVTCPAGSTSSTSSAQQPGCCLDAQPGGFTGMAINFCDGARVDLKVTSASGCAGYQLHFHD